MQAGQGSEGPAVLPVLNQLVCAQTPRLMAPWHHLDHCTETRVAELSAGPGRFFGVKYPQGKGNWGGEAVGERGQMLMEKDGVFWGGSCALGGSRNAVTVGKARPGGLRDGSRQQGQPEVSNRLVP